MSSTESLATLRPAHPAVPLRAPAPAGVLVFRLDGLRFALPAARVVEVMPLARERFRNIARMARAGTLGASGLPLVRLSTRLGLTEREAPEHGALVLFGEGGKVRLTALLEEEPVRTRADISPMPADWLARFEPCSELIGGLARLSDGRQAALIDMAPGIGERPAAAVPVTAEAGYLLVRRGGHAPEAVRLSALQAIRRPGEIAGRCFFLRFGADSVPLPVEAILDILGEGRIERGEGGRELVTAAGRYRLNDTGERPAPLRTRRRVLIAAPDSPARERLRRLARALGHSVSLADHPRALDLADGRFDVVLFDTDAYGLPAPDSARSAATVRVALGSGPAVPAGFERHIAPDDLAGLLAAALHWDTIGS